MTLRAVFLRNVVGCDSAPNENGGLWEGVAKICPYTTTTQRRGHLRVAISAVPDLSGLGRVDMLTRPVAAA